MIINAKPDAYIILDDGTRAPFKPCRVFIDGKLEPNGVYIDTKKKIVRRHKTDAQGHLILTPELDDVEIEEIEFIECTIEYTREPYESL